MCPAIVTRTFGASKVQTDVLSVLAAPLPDADMWGVINSISDLLEVQHSFEQHLLIS
jgi:hypothetical protein